MLKRKIRKFHVGGVGNLSDPRIPKAEVEIYLRSAGGETFYVASLHEAILHLLSTEGYRVGISEWPDGAGFGRDHYGVTVRREGNDLAVELRAPMVDALQSNEAQIRGESKVYLDFRPRPTPREVAENITVVPIPPSVLETQEDALSAEEASIVQEVEVTIDGT